MIRKVALVQALREAYPGAYGGIYDRDEMPEPDVPVAPPDPVAAPAEVEPAAHEAEQAAYAGDAEAEAIAEAVEPDVYEEDQSW